MCRASRAISTPCARRSPTPRRAGVDTVMVAPMIAGLSNFHRLVREHPTVAFVAHPTMAGAARIAPAFLLGTLFRVLGADAVVFPNYGGRFGYSPDTCRALARAALDGPATACVPAFRCRPAA